MPGEVVVKLVFSSEACDKLIEAAEILGDIYKDYPGENRLQDVADRLMDVVRLSEPDEQPGKLGDTSDFAQCFMRVPRPFPQTRMLNWSITHIVNDQGRPYDHYAYPHLAAPGGPMDAFDDPHIRTISEQFATRLGKTFFGLCGLLYYADRDPSPMLLAVPRARTR